MPFLFYFILFYFLQFADDTIFFSEVSLEILQNLKLFFFFGFWLVFKFENKFRGEHSLQY